MSSRAPTEIPQNTEFKNHIKKILNEEVQKICNSFDIFRTASIKTLLLENLKETLKKYKTAKKQKQKGTFIPLKRKFFLFWSILRLFSEI